MKLNKSQRRLQDLLVSALEGGSNHWYSDLDCLLPEGIEYKDFRPGGKFADPDEYFHPMQIIPFVPGCSLTLVHDASGERETVKLRERDLEKALELMKEHHADHYADVMNEDDDATTGDVFLQLAVFGELVFC